MTVFAALQPHGPLKPLFDDVWTLTGSVIMVPTVRLPRNMVILRDGDALTLINAIRLSPDAEAELAELGTVKNVVRIGMHGMDDAYYVEQHGADLWALPGVTHARGQLTTHELTPDHLPHSGVELFAFESTAIPEAALIVRTNGGLLLTCDSVQNWENTDGCSLTGSIVTHLLGFLKPAQIGPPWRKKMTPAGGSLRTDFERLAALEFKHLVGGHGVPLMNEAHLRLAETITRVYG